jgi:hypothetical protein
LAKEFYAPLEPFDRTIECPGLSDALTHLTHNPPRS